MSKFKFLLIILAISLVANASPVDKTTAAKVATNFWKSNPTTASISGSLQITNIAENQGFNTFYIFEMQDKPGFVIVAADNSVTPILGYSPNTSVIDASMPKNLKTFLRSLDRRIQYRQKNNIEASAEIATLWQQYLSNATPNSNKSAVVGPLLHTQWNQYPIYNAFCPYNTSKRELTITGCTAVAMAQVLKYWNHPQVGIGSNSYNTDAYGTISANFDNTTYDWNNMPQELNGASNRAQINAVATLMFHCGVAVNMSYGVADDGGSSAAVHGDRYATSEYAFKHFFGYKSTLWSADRENYNDTTWADLIKTELDAHRPVLYTGFDYTDTNDISGHAFVCDGYDTDGKFHFNWGWNGSFDGYFELNNLNPGMPFNDNQGAIIGMEPDSNLLMVSPHNIIMNKSGDTASVSIFSANDSANWSIPYHNSWITVSNTSGNGLGDTSNISISVAANNTGASRSGIITFQQGQQQKTVYVSQPDQSHNDAGWYGNDVASSLEPITSANQNMVIIRPESYGNFAIGDKITHIRFKHYLSYPGYNTKDFIIMIYKKPNYSILSQGSCDTLSSLGTRPVLTQYYTSANANIDQEVPLATPYTITADTFWIVLKAQGGTKLYAKLTTTNNIPASNIPLLSAVSGHYLRGYADRHLCPAFETSVSDTIGSQTDIEYYFQFKVESGKGMAIETAEKQNNIAVYPNPTSGLINLSETVNRIDVFNNIGKCVLSDTYTDNINISNLHKGLYVLRITTPLGITLKKVIKR